MPLRKNLKKPSRRKRNSSRTRPENAETGLDFAFFPEGGSRPFSWNHIASRCGTYEGTETSEILRRLRRDVKELLARAYDYDASQLPKGADAKAALAGLASTTVNVVSYFENLFMTRPELTVTVAKKFNRWPVNLWLRQRKAKGGSKLALSGADFAKDYLIELSLGSDSAPFAGAQAGDARQTSPFRLAAISVLQLMQMVKSCPPAFIEQETDWTRRLLSLPEPTTKKNIQKWWRLAKVWLDERWGGHPEEFAPLRKHLRIGELSARYPYSSSIKTRVIDGDLKTAFVGLVSSDP